MAKYDVVIIGSGLGGLLCGHMLSREGYNVCILEQQPLIGGCLQTFRRDGCVFDTGVHYVGGLDEGQNLWRYFKYFDLLDGIKMKRMDETGFERICFGDDPREFRYSMGYDSFRETLLKDFPGEGQALDAYIAKLKEVCNNFPLYNLEVNPKNMLETDYFTFNAHEYISSLTADPTLQGVLAGSNPLYAGVASKTPLYVHALIINSFIQSSWRFVDGSQQLADRLAKSIRGFGGTILTKSRVVGLDVEGEAIKTVTLENGEKIEAEFVISDIHPRTTLAMLNGGRIRTAYKERIMGLENTCSSFILYLTLKKGTAKYMNHNYYLYRDTNVWNSVEYTEADWPRSCFFFTPAVSSSDTDAESIIGIAYMRYEEVKKWENTTIGRRGAEYEEFKKRKADKFIDFIEKRFPGVRGNIKSCYASTPLTLRDYTGTADGSLYGVLKNSIDPIKTIILPKTKVQNLYLTGQNIVLHGVLGVTISAILTCSELVGLEYLVNKIKKC